MRILIYGFGPYREFTDNITQQAIALLPQIDGVSTHVFDVRFDREMFESLFDTHHPDIILGLGQHPRSSVFRVESVAKNIMRDMAMAGPINPSGATALQTNLDIPLLADTELTDDAGEYVCNFSMYVGMEYAISHDLKYGFLHIPKDLTAARVADYISEIISRLMA